MDLDIVEGPGRGGGENIEKIRGPKNGRGFFVHDQVCSGESRQPGPVFRSVRAPLMFWVRAGFDGSILKTRLVAAWRRQIHVIKHCGLKKHQCAVWVALHGWDGNQSHPSCGDWTIARFRTCARRRRRQFCHLSRKGPLTCVLVSGCSPSADCPEEKRETNRWKTVAAATLVPSAPFWTASCARHAGSPLVRWVTFSGGAHLSQSTGSNSTGHRSFARGVKPHWTIQTALCGPGAPLDQVVSPPLEEIGLERRVWLKDLGASFLHWHVRNVAQCSCCPQAARAQDGELRRAMQGSPSRLCAE